jgi:hypothetical protein
MRADGKIYRQLDDDFDFDTLADPPKWLLFLGMFNKNQRERLAARGILCAAERTLRVEKVKDGEDGVALFDFELATVELPGTEGEMSCTVDASPPSRQGRPPEPTSEKALREAFASLEATEGRQLDTGGEPAVELPLKSVRKAFARFHGGSKAAVQKAFRRLAEALPGDFEIEGKVIRRQCFPDD